MIVLDDRIALLIAGTLLAFGLVWILIQILMSVRDTKAGAIAQYHQKLERYDEVCIFYREQAKRTDITSDFRKYCQAKEIEYRLLARGVRR